MDHIQESLKLLTRRFFLPWTKFTIVHQVTILTESSLPTLQQLSLAYGCIDPTCPSEVYKCRLQSML